MDELISRQAAIMDAESWIAVDEYEKHLQKNVIEWLKEFPPAELSTNLASLGADCISREQAIDAVRMVIGDNRSISVCDAIKQLQPIQPIQPKRGRWIYCEDSMANSVDGYRCDQCGFFVPWDYKHKGIDFIQDYSFCPSCGADMR